MTKKRPFGITVLAVLVGLSALFAVYHTLQFLHILPMSFGPLHFFTFDLLGALLWGVNAGILVWVASSLWNLQMEGLLFVLLLALLNIILAVASIIGQSTFSALFPTLLINAIILIYGLTPNVKKAFEEFTTPEPPAAAPVPPAATSVLIATPPPASVVAAAPAAFVAAAAALEPEAAPVSAAPVEPEAAAVAAAAVMPEEAPAAEVPVEPEEAPVSAAPVEPEAAEPAEAPMAAPVARAKVPIETIEGIGPTYGAKLKEIGIVVVADLLDAGASRKGREDLVEKTGISDALVLKWVNMADLMRISGIGEEFSELLEAAGVDTVKELQHRVPENLYEAMLKANEQRKMVRRTPHLNEVQSWVEQAKKLDPVMTY